MIVHFDNRRIGIAALATFGVIAAIWLATANSSWGDGKLTANGVQCNDSSFEMDDLFPSIYSANRLRLTQLSTIEQFAKALCLAPDGTDEGECDESQTKTRRDLPGRKVFANALQRASDPWPSPDDPDCLYKRTQRLSANGSIDGESLRARAHALCADLMPTESAQVTDGPQPTGLVQCGALVLAEMQADVSMGGRLTEAAKSLGAVLSDAGTTPEAAAPALAQAGPLDAPRSDLKGGTTSATGAAERMKPRKPVLEAVRDVAQGYASAARAGNPSASGAGSVIDQAYLFYRCLDALPGPAVSPDLCSYKANGKGAAISVFAPDRVWPPVTAGIVTAARAVLAERTPLRMSTHVAPATSERASVQRNLDACVNATFYVSPTHDLMRHAIDEIVQDRFSVCVDTTSFAIDQPVQLILSTPAAQQIEWLWPGEPKVIHFETSDKSGSQIVHMTIGGFPRRDLLRSMARNPGGPLVGRDVFDFTEALKDAGAPRAVTASQDSMQDLARAIQSSATASDALARLGDALSDSGTRIGAPVAKQVKPPTLAALKPPTKKAITELTALIGKELPADQKLLLALLPSAADVDSTTSISALVGFAQQVDGFRDKLTSLPSASKTTSASKPPLVAQQVADELCQIGSEIVPLVSEDVLMSGRTLVARPYVIEYDFQGGFQIASAGPLMEDRPVFVIVRNVTPGWSAAVGINGKAITQRDLTLVGVSGNAGASASESGFDSTNRSALHSLNPLARELQPPSTQILALGHLSGGHRYDITVCASTDGSSNCGAMDGAASATPKTPPAKPKAVPSATDKTKTDGGASAASDGGADTAASAAQPALSPEHRIIAINTVTVHALHYLGLRAGIGMTYSLGAFQTLANEPGVTGSVVSRHDEDFATSVPLLLAIYPQGRDAMEMPGPYGYGIIGGIDLLSVGQYPRTYLGGVFDFHGFGFTTCMSVERTPFVSDPVNSVFASPASAQINGVWRPGFLFGLTTDFDIFDATFQKYLNVPQFPTVGTPGAAK